MIRIALLCAASCMLCNHRTENDFIGIASIGPVLSKIAVTVAFFFEGGAGGPYKPDGKALSPAYVDDLFQTLTASARESIHANTEICGAPANRALVREIAGEE